MERTTIDFGIDLGTTNSAVAVLNGVTPQIIKNNDEKDITPSAVYVKKTGQIYTGDRAKNALERDISCNDAFVEFKRRMGSDFEYPFPASGLRKSPEELSSEILKALRGDVSQRTGEDMRAAVITIPAMFEQAQCAATKKAGELAGFKQTALLQEPVAASLAYGFQKEISSKAFWLVFDFGGGTFDAAVMKAEDGDITVVNHGGDNFLGGADIDWAIIEALVLPELHKAGNFSGLKRGSLEWRATLARIKRSVELAKIDLSRKESTELEGLSIVDADGEPIDFEMSISRNQVSDLAEPLIIRAADICTKILKEKNLDSSALERAILVGGPTLAPYFREILTSHLGIPLDYGVDPMTVVARGAAVFAGTQRLKVGTAKSPTQSNTFTISVNYNPVGADDDPRVSGEVSSPDGSSMEGFSIEFYNRQTMWSSGRIMMREEGKFTLRLLAESGMKNDFDIRLYSPDGTKCVLSSSTISYTVGMTVKSQTVTNDLAVELDGNKKSIIVAKGEAYPFKKTNRDFKTTALLHHGTDEELKIPILEGAEEKADCNKLVGSVTVSARDLRLDLPVGSDVEVTFEAKEPGAINVSIYIPLFEYEANVPINLKANAPAKEVLRAEYEKDYVRLKELADKNLPIEKVRMLVDEAKRAVESATDYESRQQAFNAIIESRKALDSVEDEAKWPENVRDAKDKINAMKNSVERWGDLEQKGEAQEIENEMHRAIQRKSTGMLNRVAEKAIQLLIDIESNRPEVWKSILVNQYKNRELMSDKRKADVLFEQAAIAIKSSDVEEMRRIAKKLWELLPEEVADETKRGYGSGITL